MKRKQRYWHVAVVELKDGHCIEDRTLENKKEFKAFLKEHGYKLKAWKKAEQWNG